jgi:tripartite-type tricarboxylate transporter receptor subunit TctC
MAVKSRWNLARALALSLLAASCVAVRSPALADGYPTKPIKFIIPIPPGGASDILARLVGDKLSTGLGRAVIPENYGGANGQIGLNLLSRAAPDGYTIGVAATTHLVLPIALRTKTQYDPVKSFAFIGRLATSGSFIGVNPSLHVNTVSELIALAKTKPGGLFFATPGTGSTMHLVGELFNQTAGTQITHVPFKGGGPAVAAVMGDSGVAVGMFTIPSALSFAESGQIKALAILDDKRYPGLPNVPALTETFPGMEIPQSWYALVAPAGLPDDIAMRLNTEMTRALADPEVQTRLHALGFEAAPSTPKQIQDIAQRETAIWKQVVDRAGIKVE